MRGRSTIGALALKVVLLAAALVLAVDAVTAGEEIKYPDWKGQWRGVLRVGTFGGQPSVARMQRSVIRGWPSNWQG
jgi:hypothetical protein